MKYKIKHESKMIRTVSVIAFVLAVAALFFLEGEAAGVITLFAILFALLFYAMSLIEKTAGTTIIIENGYVVIKHILWKKKVSIAEISAISADRYEESRRRSSGHALARYTEWRIRMTMTLASGKTIELTDTATKAVRKSLLRTYEPLPDEEVPLYMAYQIIESMKR